MANGNRECRRNGHAYHWSWYCGDRVCDVCIKHETRIRCACGWPESVRRKEGVPGMGSGERASFGNG